jgi:subtilisin family serine protease
VGAANVGGVRLGYSGQGPGSIEAAKPDVLAFAHFRGPAGAVMCGTSMAAPLAAGALAMLRGRVGPGQLSPLDLLREVRRRARPTIAPGYRRDTGWGLLDIRAVVDALT